MTEGIKTLHAPRRDNASCPPWRRWPTKMMREFFHPLSTRERETLMTTLEKLMLAHGLHKLPIE